MKLHRQFGHATAVKLVKLLRSAGVNRPELESELHKLIDSCKVCITLKRPVPRPVVGLPIAQRFNDVVAMDLKSFGGVYFLVLIDHATRYCASVVINNKKPATIVQALMLMWIPIFGPPAKFLFDNGGEFVNEEMRQLGETFNIKLMTTAAESPWSNGLVEKLNGVLAQNVRKVMEDSRCDTRTALAWAVYARNTLENSSGFSPNQLVFGYNTIFPNVFSGNPAVLEDVSASDVVRDNLNAMHSARQAFVKTESCEKIRRALRHNLRESDAQTVEIGDQVFYKRNDNVKWRGPGVVIGRDGKQVIVKHGGIMVRVHVCRLTPEKGMGRDELPTEDKNMEKGETLSPDQPMITDELIENSNENIVAPDQLNTRETPIVLEENEEIEEYFTPEEDVDSDEEPGEAEENQIDAGSMCMKAENVRVGQRVKGVNVKTGETVTGKIISRAGKSTSTKHRFCYNLQKNDNSVEWYDFEKDIQDLCEVDDDEEVLMFFNDDRVMAAKDSEIENWQNNRVYTEVENKGQPSISVKWVITEKIKGGKPVLKARLVARGFEEDSSELQKDAPTCLKESVKITLAIASSKCWKLQSLDVRSAYLQGAAISREVFLKPPVEYNHGYLWKLNKVVYGLSDAARSWYIRVRDELIALGMSVCPLDSAVFSYVVDGKLEGLVCLYVDDFLYCGTSSFERNVISQVQKEFLVGSIEEDKFKYIGLNIISSPNMKKSTIDQIDYCISIEPMKISRARLNNRLSELTPEEKSEFRSIIGQLNWVATQTRPDIAFDVCELSGCVGKSTVADIVKLNKIVARLTTDCVKITVPRMDDISNCFLECFSDSSYANLPSGGSQGGFIVFLKDGSGNSCPIYWQSRKIRRVVKSTLAAETLALLDGAEAAHFIASIISHLLIIPPIKIACYVDNLSLANAIYSSKLVEDRRLRIDIAVLQDMMKRGELDGVKWVRSEDQLADSLTKRGVSTERLRKAISC